MVYGLPNISGKSVTNYLKKHGIKSRVAAQKTLLNSRDQAIRLEIAQRNLQRPASDWERTIFIDEFHIETNAKRKIRVKRFRGERFDPIAVNHYNGKNSKRMTAVCCFSSKGLGPMRMVFDSFRSADYIDYLPTVLPYAEANFPSHEYGINNFFYSTIMHQFIVSCQTF